MEQTILSPGWMPLYFLEKYPYAGIMVGYYKGKEHLKWIMGGNSKGMLAYNVRLRQNVRDLRDGAHNDKFYLRRNVKFVILYTDNYATTGNYHVFLVKDTTRMDTKRMSMTNYPSEVKGDYFVYRFLEEVSLGTLDIKKLIDFASTKLYDETGESAPYAPSFATCQDLIDNKIRTSLIPHNNSEED